MDDTASAVNDAPAPSAAPVSFAEAFASDASPASDPSQQTTTPSAAEQPTSDAQAQPQQSDERSPMIPRPRFDEVNAKYNELKTWKESRAWAEQVDQQTFTQMAQWYQQAHTDPLTFATNLIAELQTHPVHGQALRSLAARTLAQGRGGSQPAPALDGIAIDLGNGQQVTLGDLKAQWLQEVRNEFQPVAKTVREIETERAQLQAKAQADEFASGFFKELSQLPNFADHKAAIAQEVQAMQLASDHPAEVQAATLRAYLKVVLPTLSQKAQSQLLDNLQQKAAASTSVNPGSAANATSRRYDSFAQLPAELWR